MFRLCYANVQKRHFFKTVKNFAEKIETPQQVRQRKNQSTVHYVTGIGLFTFALAYAAVPIYRIFCQQTSVTGEVQRGDESKIVEMKPVKDRVIKINFNANTAVSMMWNFKPQQREIYVVPGETALAFYTATNPTDKPVIGVSTYNVVPYEAGQYFNKIQCFCFDEQQLNPHEEVDMPVFFYISPEFADDPKMEHIDSIVLSYTFFEAKPGLELPIPSYVKERLS